MRRDVLDVVLGLVATFDLHNQQKVKLDSLEGLFPVRYASLREQDVNLLGVCLPPESLPVTAMNPARILIDDSIEDNLARLVYAHEIGHAIHGHPGEMRWRGMDRWFVDKQERQAWEVAAYLLIPFDLTVCETRTICAVAYVPEWLVQLRTSMSIN